MLTLFTSQHKIALGRAKREGDPCSTSCVERSDRSDRSETPNPSYEGLQPIEGIQSIKHKPFFYLFYFFFSNLNMLFFSRLHGV